MSRKLILCAIILATSLLASTNLHSQIRVGVKGGYDLLNEKITINSFNAKNRMGYYVGGTVEAIVPMSGFGGDISVLYGQKKYKMEDKLADASISDYNYISIPINIKQRISLGKTLGVFVSGGVYGNVKVDGGNIKIKDVVDEYKAKNFAFGLNAGAGISLLNHLDLGVYFRGELTKRYGSEFMDAGTFQNKKFQTWSAAMTYFF